MAVSIFFCYAHEDEDLLNKLKRHLWPLQRQGLIAVWHDRDISAGSEWEREISQHLNAAQIILLLVSPDFMYSEYCYGVEMKRAIERHQRGEARVIPIIVRPVYWQGTLGHLQALPTDGLPVTDPDWHTLDRALYNVTEGIRTVVVQLGTQSVSPPEVLLSPAWKGQLEAGSLPVLSPQTVKPLPSLKPEALSLLRTLTGHTSTVSSVAFSPDGQTVASGSWDGTIKLWNLATGEEVRTLTGHTHRVWSVAFSPDSQTLASGSFDNTIKLWNLATGKEVRTLTGHTSYVYSVAFSPDGQTLLSGSDDKTIKLWNVTSGKEVRTLTGHTNSVRSVAFSPDGQTLLSGSDDKTIKLWNLATGKEVHTLTGHINSVWSVAFSPDGQTVASGSGDGTIQLWNLATGEEVHTLTGHTDSVRSVAYSPDSQTLASGSWDNTIKIWGNE